MTGLYLHIPFCIRRCVYCGFYLETMKGPISQRLREADTVDHSPFLNALERELSDLPNDFQPSTVYIGGGTPTELSAKDFKRLLHVVEARIDLSKLEEWTVEANPGTCSEAIEDMLAESGVNRLSIGAQCFDDKRLEFLGRLHSAAETIEMVHRLRAKGFRNINLDLIINQPNSRVEDLKRDVEILVELAPQHSSCYSMEYDAGTPLTKMRDQGFIQEVPEDMAVDQYHALIDGMTSAGFRHYELFNFARPGFESRHNQNYWNAGEYFGCGPSACSHWQGARWQNIANLGLYTQQIMTGKHPRVNQEQLDPVAKARETLMTGLRQTDGISEAWFEATCGMTLEACGGDALARQIEWGSLIREGGRIRLAPAAWLTSDQVFRDIL